MHTIEDNLKYLYGLKNTGIKLGLDRIKWLVSLLNNPHTYYPSIIVGGTNGKGSTSSMIESVLRHSGLKTGLLTSPHLERFNERIKIDGQEISDRELSALISALHNSVKGLSSEASPSFFEFTTVMAFQHFKKSKVKAAVLEVGMGGRLDAVNVVTPHVSVITNVSKDHEKALGNSLKDIALEKAGIIKPGVPVVCGAEARTAAKVIDAVSYKKKTDLYQFDRDFSVTLASDGSFDYESKFNTFTGLRTGLFGAHQVKNAACALAAIELMQKKGFVISEQAIREGLANAFWPGRFELISEEPMVVLDCAHNPAAAITLADSLKSLEYENLILVLGVMKDKALDEILKWLVPLASRVIVTKPDIERAIEPEDLERMIAPFGVETLLTERVESAVDIAKNVASPRDLVCVAGSLFTVGEARTALRPR